MTILTIISITVVISRILCFCLINLLKDDAADNAEQVGCCVDGDCWCYWDADGDGACYGDGDGNGNGDGHGNVDIAADFNHDGNTVCSDDDYRILIITLIIILLLY